jgi:hypothetical protein
MPEQSVIVWDLETVPDLSAGARMLHMSEEPEADIRQALGSGFQEASAAPHRVHRRVDWEPTTGGVAHRRAGRPAHRRVH